MRTHSMSHSLVMFNLSLMFTHEPAQPLSHFANSTTVSSSLFLKIQTVTDLKIQTVTDRDS